MPDSVEHGTLHVTVSSAPGAVITISAPVLSSQPPRRSYFWSWCHTTWDEDGLPERFRKFRHYCGLVCSTPNYTQQTPQDIVNMIFLWLGPEGVEISDSWTHLDKSQKSDQTYVWNAFEAYLEPKTSFRLSCFQLRDLKQQPKETADALVTCL